MASGHERREDPMEYVVGLFADRPSAEGAADAVTADGIAAADCTIKEHEQTMKGRFERVFDITEPLSTMEADGVSHEDAPWYEEQIDEGRVLLVVRTERDATRVAGLLRSRGADALRLYGWWGSRWVRRAIPEVPPQDLGTRR